MKRFQWKLLSVMLMVSVIPLAFSAVLVNQLFRDAVTLAFDQAYPLLAPVHQCDPGQRHDDPYQRYQQNAFELAHADIAAEQNGDHTQ